ncbi:SAM-dependent methyltransferase [Proteobacteria bacterium 005FR1]|nr:SAM-dependent methyltransferase [Proteobacteria bacterium 005FR1]
MSDLPAAATVSLVCCQPALLDRARQLAADLNLALVEDSSHLPPGSWQLQLAESGLAMQQVGPKAPGPVRVDFVGGTMGFRRQHQEATPDLVKAVGVRSGVHPLVWDVTAGLGQDGFVLARYGCQVRLFERNPLVFHLLEDGLARARSCAENGDENLLRILQRIQLVSADSIERLSDDQLFQNEEAELPEVIYIDTMFPERAKSAKVKKGMQLFQDIVGEDVDADRLLELALERARNRVVVKRPRHAPSLGSSGSPSLSFTGKSIRFDVYALKKLQRPETGNH